MSMGVPVNLSLILPYSSVNNARKQLTNGLSNIPININSTGMSKTNAQVQSLNKNLKEGKASARGFTSALSLKAKDAALYTILSAAIYKVSGAVANATREAIRYQSELSKIAQTVDVSNKAIFEQSSALREISVSYNVSLTKIAQLTKTLAQTGLSFREAAKAAELLSKTSLLASFDNLTDTTEGFIAVMATFKISVEEAASVLESINILSKKYAVESSDLVEAISRTGGAFQAAGGRINELLALITSVRSTTREGVETIATAFRTIFGRLQRPQTIEFFKQLNVELLDLEGNFIGPFQAIQAISKGLDKAGIAAGSVDFAQVVEQIGGIRQMSKVIPLLLEAKKSVEALSLADNAGASTAMDLAKAQETVSFKLGQLQKNFQSFISEILESETFNTFAKSMIEIANALIEVGRSLGPLTQPLKLLMEMLSSLAKFSPILSMTAAVFGAKVGGALLGKGVSKAKSVVGFARGGVVPGSGSGDTVPAMLTPGEFVIRKSAVEAFGAENLAKINKYARGGPVSEEEEQVRNMFSKARRSKNINRNVLDDLERETLDIETVPRPEDALMSIKDVHKEAQRIYQLTADGLEDFSRPLIRDKNLYRMLPTLRGGESSGLFYLEPDPDEARILIKKGANKKVLAHEMAHGMDYIPVANRGTSLRSGQKAPQTNFFSEDPNTFQGALARNSKSHIMRAYNRVFSISRSKLLEDDNIKQLMSTGMTFNDSRFDAGWWQADEDSRFIHKNAIDFIRTRTKPEEIFANLFEQSPDDIKKILVSTRDPEQGFKALKDAKVERLFGGAYTAQGYASGGSVAPFKPQLTTRANSGYGDVGRKKQYLAQYLDYLKKLDSTGQLSETQKKELDVLKKRIEQQRASRTVRFKRRLGFANGGSVGTDTVPAMLTPGEFVINKKSAEAFGYGNLNKINKYAKGGPVEVQRFADGGTAQALSALGSLSLTDSFGPLFQAFAQLSLATSVTTGAAEGLATALKSAIEASKAEKKARIEAAGNIVALQKKEAELVKEISALQQDLSSTTNLLDPSGVANKNIAKSPTRMSQADYDAIIKASEAKGKSQTLLSTASSKAEVDVLVSSLKEKYSNNAKVVAGIDKLLLEMKGEYSQQLTALQEYSSQLQQTTAALEDKEASLQKSVKANEASLEAIRSQITEAKKPKQGIVSRAIGQIGIGNIANFAAQTGVTVVSAGFLSLARNSEKAAESAILAGNSNEAYAKTIESLSQEQKSSAISTGAAIGAGLGAFAGPFGSAIGTIIGALVGATGVLSTFTDWIGLTTNALERQEAARKNALSADVQAVDKIQAKAIKDFEDTIGLNSGIRGEDSKKSQEAARKLAESSKQVFDKIQKSQGLNFDVTGQGAEEGRQTFDKLIESFSTLANRAENEGLAIDDLTAKYPELIKTIEMFEESLGDGAKNVKESAFAIVDLNAKRIKNELTARSELVSILKRQVSSQAAIGGVLSLLSDSAYQAQLALSGFTEYENISKQTGKETFAQTRSLDAVKSLGPAFGEIVDRVRKVSTDFGQSFSQSLTSIAALPVRERQSAVEDLVKSLSLGDNTDYVRAELSKLFDPSKNNTEIKEGILQITSSIRDTLSEKDLQSINDTISSLNASFKQQLEISSRLIEADRQAFENRLQSNQREKDFTAKALSLTGASPEQRFAVSKFQRESSVKKLLSSDIQFSGLARQVGGPSQFTLLEQEITKVELELKSLASQGRQSTEEYRRLNKQSIILESAFEDLADSSLESSAVFDKASQIIEERAALRNLRRNYAFSSSAERRSTQKTFQDALKVANFGINAVSGERRSSVEQLLQQLKNTRIFAGSTGQEVLNRETARGLSGLGFNFNQIQQIMQDMTQEESKLLESANRMEGLDKTRNDLLNQLLNEIRGGIYTPQDNIPIAQGQSNTGIKLSTMPLQLFADGGGVFKPRGTDTVPAMLTPGEFVLRKSAVDKIGVSNLEKMNKTGTVYAADGAYIPDTAYYMQQMKDREALLAKVQSDTEARRQRIKSYEKMYYEPGSMMAPQSGENAAPYAPSNIANAAAVTGIPNLVNRGLAEGLPNLVSQFMPSPSPQPSPPAPEGLIKDGGYKYQSLADRSKEMRSRYENYIRNYGGPPSKQIENAWMKEMGLNPVSGKNWEYTTKFASPNDPDAFKNAKANAQAAKPTRANLKEAFSRIFAGGENAKSVMQDLKQRQNAQPVPAATAVAKPTAAKEDQFDPGVMTPMEEPVPLPRDPSTQSKSRAYQDKLIPITKTPKKTLLDQIKEVEGTLNNPRVQGFFRQQAMIRLQGLQMRYQQTQMRAQAQAQAQVSNIKQTPSRVNASRSAQFNRMRTIGVKTPSNIIDSSGMPQTIMETPLEREQRLRKKSEFKWKQMQEQNQGKHYDPATGKWMSGGGLIDTVPAMLSPGEFVLNKSAVRNIGRGPLESMNNSGKVKGYANGGYVGGTAYLQNGGSATGGIDISSFTRSVDTFLVGVKELVSMPKVFEISLNNMGVNVNLNGAELIGKLPALMQSIIYEQIMNSMGQIVQKVKASLSAGN